MGSTLHDSKDAEGFAHKNNSKLPTAKKRKEISKCIAPCVGTEGGCFVAEM